SLDQQTATADILRVISQSPTDVQPVLDVVAEAAQRFCGAADVVISLREGDELRIAAHAGPMRVPSARRKLDRSSSQGRAIVDARVVHTADFTQLDPAEWSKALELSREFGFNSAVAAPMLRDGAAIGTIFLRRPETGPFAPRQIALLEAFAAQAVIAIENVRLFTELREALDQQTATAEVLEIINRSQGDLHPVFDTIVAKAMALCDAAFGMFNTFDGERFHTVATRGIPQAYARYRAENPPDYGPETAPGRLITGEDVIQVADMADSDLYRNGDPNRRSIVDLGGARTILNLALRREGKLLGMIAIYRQEVKPFTEQQIALVQGFATQAVIAMENARLLSELRESLDQQTATADILRVISQSPTDVAPVLDAVAKAALRFCTAEDVVITLREGDHWLIAGHEGPMPASIGTLHPLNRQTSPSWAILDAKTIHLPDITSLDPVEYAAAHDFSRRQGFKAAVAAPMLREGQAVGAIALRRAAAGAFTPRQIELLESFAAQAVIALENTRLFTELRQRTDDLTESLEYQTATSELLEVISRSSSDIQPVFDTMLASAARLCGVEKGDVAIQQGEVFRHVAFVGCDPEELAWLKARVTVPGRGTSTARALLERRVDHVLDQSLDPERVAPKVATRPRTTLAVPLMRDGEPLGVISLLRDHVEPFSERQIALIETFADQAVIAMENARLLSELTQRTDDLAESLDYQTATSEVLGVISRSPTTLQPVLEAMTAAAVRLCGVKTGGLSVRRGDTLEFVALVGQTPEFERWQMSAPIPVARGVPLGDAILDKAPVQIVDVMETEAYKAGAEVERAVADIGGHRTLLHVPLLREDEAIGVLTVSRGEPEAFTERQIGLIKTFADQAVIAMENARLLSELRERTDDLTQSLEYQTATSEVLEVISRSTTDIQPVLDKLVSLGLRLAEADHCGIVLRSDDGRFRFRALAGPATEVVKATGFLEREIPPGRDTIAGRALLEQRVVHVEDIHALPDYAVPEVMDYVRTTLSVPLMRDGEAVGVINLTRSRVELFTDRQVALVKTFADQAVIAMENARLLGELTRREEELRVTFDHMGDGVVMFDADLKLAAWNRNFQELLDIPDTFLAPRPGLEDYVRLLVERGELGHDNPDEEIERYRERANRAWSAERTRPDGRTLEVRNNPVPGGGAVLIYSDITERKKAEAEIRAARDAAEAALDKLKAAQANLVQSEKMASLGQLTAGIAHEIKNPLNFVNNFATLSVDLLDELKEVAGPALATLDEDKRAELDETMELLTGNLGKIAEHGKRADGIVKSMLSHSRGGTGDWAPSDINALVEEALNLAYHGARAQDKEFNVTLERDFEKASKPIEVVPQDVTRVFLNLFGNGFYAANKRRLGARESGFRPTLTVTTRETGDGVEVKVRDNGTGIPPEVREKLFQPFFTTKPTGEGTGLGLSISYDIVTQQHGGTIGVESEVGKFTEFTVRLPRSRRVVPAEKV
ncbi:MAG: GAF domain-containing protein, partial [Reyranella sp.]|nr:GAF domain-containing protein [Reyranella sp.]